MDANPEGRLSISQEHTPQRTRPFSAFRLSRPWRLVGKGPERKHLLPPSDQEKVATSCDPLNAGVAVVAAFRGAVHSGVTVIAAPRDTVRVGVTVVAAPRWRRTSCAWPPEYYILSGSRRHSRQREQCTSRHWPTVTRPRVQRHTRARSVDSQSQ